MEGMSSILARWSEKVVGFTRTSSASCNSPPCWELYRAGVLILERCVPGISASMLLVAGQAER